MNQVALITGGGNGIGRAVAHRMANAGIAVIVADYDHAAAEKVGGEIKAAGGKAEALAIDVTVAREVKAVVTDVSKRYGRIDILANIAGGSFYTKRVEEFTWAEWKEVVDVNLKGSFLLSLAVGRHMLERRKGNQINIASLNNDRPLTGVLPYAISKAGLGHMTRALALEWGDRGVRVNAIAPGFILTDLTRKLWSQPALKEWGLKNTPLRRLGQPEDLVGTAIFLASEASAFMTGQVLFVDGGFSCGLAWPIDFGNQ